MVVPEKPGKGIVTRAIERWLIMSFCLDDCGVDIISLEDKRNPIATEIRPMD
jgi:hypothetical protein